MQYNPNDYGFRGENDDFIKKIAKKYDLSIEGIKEIKHVSDLKQLERRFTSELKAAYPGAKLMWNPKTRTSIIQFFTNDKLDIFGFAKVIQPKNEDEAEGLVAMVPFHMKDPLPKVQKLF